MSADLMRKRKLSATSSDVSGRSSPSHPVDIENDRNASQPNNKRLRCETPPSSDSEEDTSNAQPPPSEVALNRHLLENIKLKIMELQNNINDIDDTLEDDELPNVNISEQEAEAIGYATCAQETLLFLQREGIPMESELYRKLRETLTGQDMESDHSSVNLL